MTRARVGLTLSVVFALIATVGLGLRSVSLSPQPFQAVSAGAIYLMLASPVAVLLAIASRAWVAVVATSVLLVACAAVEAPLFVAQTPPKGGVRLTMMTANLRLGEADAWALTREVQQKQVDVLTVQELTPIETSQLAEAGMAKVLPYHLLAPGRDATGVGIWSRFRLSDEHRPSGLTFNVVSAAFDVPHARAMTSVLAVHLAGPWPGPTTEWEHDITFLPSILRGVASTWPLAAVLVGGDFNATFDSSQFRHLLKRGFRDAAEQAGAGVIRTYPADTWYPPAVGVDHVLTRNAVATSATTLGVKGSDHDALLVHVTLPRQ